jgi:hypothetical protein
MKQPALVPKLFALALAAGTSMLLAPGCGGGEDTNATGGGGGTSTSTSTAGSGGGTTTTETNVQCATLCGYLASIDCNVLKNCVTDCENHLNAPADCTDEADALIACWVEHQQEFTCTKQQVLPPPSCSEQETVFNTCVNGGMVNASCICSAGVGVGDMTTNCSRKTTCGDLEYTQVCQKLNDGTPWTCSCFTNGGLLGTCSEQDQFEHCSNQYGCCVSLFCAGGGQE